MFNITTKEGKQRYQQEMIKRMIAIERVIQKELKPILGRQYLNAAKFVESGITDIDYAVSSESPRLKATIEKQYRRCGTIFSKIIFDGLEETQKGIIQVPFAKGMKEDFWASMLSWIKTYGAKKVVQINETTRNAIKNIIARGKEDGKSYAKIAKDLRTIKDVATPVRSKRIARTEVHSASTKGLHSAVGATGIKSEKEWVSFIDERIRGLKRTDRFNHIIANGERVAFEEKFRRTGEDLDYPGDPEGSAGNIIQCRCIQLYHVVRSYLQTAPKPKPISIEVTEEWVDIDDMDVIKDRFSKNLGIKKYKVSGFKSEVEKKDSILRSNEIGKELTRLRGEFPKLKEMMDKVDDKHKIDFLKMYNRSGVNSRTVGYYTRWGEEGNTLEFGGKRSLDRELKIGAKNWGVGEDFYSVFRHEFAHHLNMTIMAPDPKKVKKWIDLVFDRIDKNKKEIRNSISYYAGKDIDELFAESFSAYTSPLYGKKGQKLPKDIEKYFEDLIGRRM